MRLSFYAWLRKRVRRGAPPSEISAPVPIPQAMHTRRVPYPFSGSDDRDINDIELPNDFPKDIEIIKPASRVPYHRRRLSVSSTEASSPPRLPQLDCLLFQLPRELRDEIYLLVLCKRMIHLTPTNFPKILVQNGTVIAHRRTFAWHSCQCPLPWTPDWNSFYPPDESLPGNMCASYLCADWIASSRSVIWTWVTNNSSSQAWLADGSNDLLALPLTCSRLYTETIDMIYSRNKFHVSAKLLNDCATRLAPYVPTQRLRNIRSLCFSVVWDGIFRPNEYKGRYEAFWKGIRSCFTGLREIEACYFFREKIVLDLIDADLDEDDQHVRKPGFFERFYIEHNRATVLDPIQPLTDQVRRFKLWVMLPDYMLDSWRDGAPSNLDIEGGYWLVKWGNYSYFHWE